ncbi:fibroblast growth factor receptor 1-like [Anneissia japonica]|uniref:fibroblast growth factor receptor 1-like n=1 Tax=Anneissia japonica TaxID=1529436 RepID=UPI0014256B75|nr:fibroblast growth factor receptor 1-like [Anneissia japonica]
MKEDVYAVPFAQENNTVNEMHPDDLHKYNVILEGNHSRVCRGKVPSFGLTNVAIKTLKEDHNVKEKERMLHEIKMMRLLPWHENIIRLLGFTSIREYLAETVVGLIDSCQRTCFRDEYTQLAVRWTAVEGLSTNKRLFSMKSDVWSFGVLMWEILTLGSKPYGKMSINTVVEKVSAGLRLKKPENISNELYSVMNACWHTTPESRPSFENLASDLDSVISSNEQSVDTSYEGGEYFALDVVRR